MELSLMQRFADPELIKGLSTSELTQGALITTLMGMGTTFVVLTLLWGVIAIISKVILKTEKKAITVLQKPIPMPTTAPAAPKTAEPAAADAGTELVAVITAAIAAMEEATSTSGLIIRKISRISGNNTAWSRAGASEVLESRKF
ncbi:MAG: OadG family protein [Bacillota bacterium]